MTPKNAATGSVTYAIMAAGANHTCALVAVPLGGIECWGANGSGQLGTGSLIPANQPTPSGVVQ